MAIVNTQSTSQILAEQARASRLQSQQSQIAPPDRSNLSGGNPISMISSGLNQSVNSLTAGDRRLAAQQDNDRQNAIRLEQQAYSRGQKEQDRNLQQDNTNYRRNQDALRNATSATKLARDNRIQDATIAREAEMHQLALSDRNAQIAGEHANIELQAQLADVGAREVEAYAQAGIPVTGAELAPLQDMERYDAERAKNGDTFNAGSAKFTSLVGDVAENAAAYETFQSNLNRIVANAKDRVNKGTSSTKDRQGRPLTKATKAEGSWVTPYEELAKQRMLADAAVGAGWWSRDGSIQGESKLVDKLVTEMQKIHSNMAKYEHRKQIKNSFDNERNQYTVDASKKGLRSPYQTNN